MSAVTVTTTTTDCTHPYPVLHCVTNSGGWAECRDCGMEAAFWIDFEEWAGEQVRFPNDR